ncbi:MAG: isoprenylcysteine carboxylmethyltransferase family protein [Proteobacteria bacterium]|nr:isoprenylcysteine carboxylmethyltransferase family protein [Pseudomonadota bacterium]
MRNPIRLKNFRLRFLPYYAVGLLVVAWTRPTPLGFAIGAGLACAGLALRSWGAGHLVKNDHFTVTGPYAHVRHPLYLGTLLIGTGFGVIAGGWLALPLIAALGAWFFLDYFPRKERIESARLEALYGAEYARYRAEVPALLASLRPWPGRTPEEPTAAASWQAHRFADNNELGTLLAVVAGLGLFALRAAVFV